jgi:hypothetical protein
MLASKGFFCLNYIDDFLLDVLVALIQSLGLEINWEKVEGPATEMIFLGVHINCESRVLSLPPKKLSQFKVLLATWVSKEKVTKKSLQSLVGKLNWASRVVLGGRTFLRNLINLLSKACLSHHYIWLSSAAKHDIRWWVRALDLFHGFAPFPDDVPLPTHEFACDACEEGGGPHFQSDWFYTSWKMDHPTFYGKHINVLNIT